jgi:hypothetical protein
MPVNNLIAAVSASLNASLSLKVHRIKCSSDSTVCSTDLFVRSFNRR